MMITRNNVMVATCVEMTIVEEGGGTTTGLVLLGLGDSVRIGGLTGRETEVGGGTGKVHDYDLCSHICFGHSTLVTVSTCITALLLCKEENNLIHVYRMT